MSQGGKEGKKANVYIRLEHIGKGKKVAEVTSVRNVQDKDRKQNGSII